MAKNSVSPVKHTAGGEMPDASAVGRAEERLEADLPLLSDPVILRRIAWVGGALALGLSLGLGIFFFKRGRP